MYPWRPVRCVVNHPFSSSKWIGTSLNGDFAKMWGQSSAYFVKLCGPHNCFANWSHQFRLGCHGQSQDPGGNPDPWVIFVASQWTSTIDQWIGGRDQQDTSTVHGKIPAFLDVPFRFSLLDPLNRSVRMKTSSASPKKYQNGTFRVFRVFIFRIQVTWSSNFWLDFLVKDEALEVTSLSRSEQAPTNLGLASACSKTVLDLGIFGRNTGVIIYVVVLVIIVFTIKDGGFSLCP